MQDASILQRAALFYHALYIVTGKMPKRDKYTLGERTHLATLALIEYLIAASHLGRERKLLALEQASVKLDVVRLLLRLAQELKAVPTKTYLELIARLDEIGKMLGGWMRSLK